MGHRSAALRRRGPAAGACPGVARPCSRPPRVAWAGGNHCRARCALCTRGSRRSAIRPRPRPRRAQSGLHAALCHARHRNGSGREVFNPAKIGALVHLCRRRRDYRLACRERSLEPLAHPRRCAVFVRRLPDGLFHGRHAPSKARSTACGSARRHRIAGDLFAHLSGPQWASPRAAATRRVHLSGDLPGRPRDYCWRCPLRPRGYYPRRLGGCGLWRIGAGVVSIARDPASQRMARPDRLAWHRPDFRRRLSRERRTVAAWRQF